MKRLWISLAVIVLLLVFTFWHIQAVRQTTEHLTCLLESAQSAAAAGNWSRAQTLSNTAQEEWESVEGRFGLVLRMGDTDEVELAFQETKGYLQAGEQAEYESANASLLTSIRHLAQAEQCNWQNIL